MSANPSRVIIRDLQTLHYLEAWKLMREFVDNRDELATDEIWFVEHPPVFTLGQSGKCEHLLNPGTIEIVHSDRGGQVTYHGPGQLLAYVLLNVRQKAYGVKALVHRLEQTIIDLMLTYGIIAERKAGAPGIYVNGAKLCSIGLRIRHGISYHGVALNVDMDLEPFQRINPCGFQGLQMTQLRDLGVTDEFPSIKQKLISALTKNLEFTVVVTK